MTKSSNQSWFDNCGGWSPIHSADALRIGIDQGLLNEQDEYGMTALSLAVSSGWKEGVDELIRAGADPELRYFRTGETALHIAVQEKNEPMIMALIKGGANPDAANHWGITPRNAANNLGLSHLFELAPSREVRLLDPWVQNAEHLADHYHPRFKIPDRKERDSLQPGQAVDLYIFGPRVETKQDAVKVRISAKSGQGPNIRYVAVVETPLEKTHLQAGTREVEFGPENVASVYVPRESKVQKDGKSA